MNTAGSYSYNTNNDMTGTKKLDAYRTISGTNYKIAYRAQWTFAFDRKNRLKTHTYPSGLNVRGNIWYDGIGRVWQRWNDDSVTGDWDADLQRFVYDGAALAQEHKFTASGNGTWTYSYGRCDIDYLRKPDGIRQKVNNGVGGWDSHLLFNDGADVASRTPAGSSTAITRTLRTASGDRLNDNPRMTAGLGSGSFSNISNLAKPNSYIESYGGGTELGTSSLGYDSLVQSGPVHQLPALGGMILNSPPGGGTPPPKAAGGPAGGGSAQGTTGYWKVGETCDEKRPGISTGLKLGMQEVVCCCFYDRWWSERSWTDYTSVKTMKSFAVSAGCSCRIMCVTRGICDSAYAIVLPCPAEFVYDASCLEYVAAFQECLIWSSVTFEAVPNSYPCWFDCLFEWQRHYFGQPSPQCNREGFEQHFYCAPCPPKDSNAIYIGYPYFSDPGADPWGRDPLPPGCPVKPLPPIPLPPNEGPVIPPGEIGG